MEYLQLAVFDSLFRVLWVPLIGGWVMAEEHNRILSSRCEEGRGGYLVAILAALLAAFAWPAQPSNQSCGRDGK